MWQKKDLNGELITIAVNRIKNNAILWDVFNNVDTDITN